MGNAHQFGRWRRNKRPAVWLAITALLGGILIGIIGLQVMKRSPILAITAPSDAVTFGCSSIHVVDGDTLRCGERRIRLSGIDAPETGGICSAGRRCVSGDPVASTESLRRLISGQSVMCRQTDIDRYGRIVALCTAGNIDLSCEQVRSGNAVRRYAPLTC
jgi:endonuclease YncB( thermonuclease family)